MKGIKRLLVSALCIICFLNGTEVLASLTSSPEDTVEKRIALSFDDGPHPRYTPMILDILEEYGIPATFFVIGQNAALYPSPLVRAAEAGHEIGNHTYTHPKMRHISDEEMIEELNRCQEEIFRKTGRTPTLFRPPEGFQRKTESEILSAFGLTEVMWEIDTRDWSNNSTSDIIQIVKREAGDGKIILFHDYVGKENHTVAALKTIVPYLLKQGYRFTTVSDILKEGRKN